MTLDLTHRIDLFFVKIGRKLLFSYDFYGWIGQLDLFYPKSQFHTFSGSLQNGYLLCSGSMKDNKILVKGARRSTDIEMDLGRMEKIEQGILKLS
jgi:hypothetical protein